MNSPRNREDGISLGGLGVLVFLMVATNVCKNAGFDFLSER